MTQNSPPPNGQGEVPEILAQALQASASQQDLQFYQHLLTQNMKPEEAAMHTRIYRELRQRSMQQ